MPLPIDAGITSSWAFIPGAADTGRLAYLMGQHYQLLAALGKKAKRHFDAQPLAVGAAASDGFRR